MNSEMITKLEGYSNAYYFMNKNYSGLADRFAIWFNDTEYSLDNGGRDWGQYTMLTQKMIVYEWALHHASPDQLEEIVKLRDSLNEMSEDAYNILLIYSLDLLSQ